MWGVGGDLTAVARPGTALAAVAEGAVDDGGANATGSPVGNGRRCVFPGTVAVAASGHAFAGGGTLVTFGPAGCVVTDCSTDAIGR